MSVNAKVAVRLRRTNRGGNVGVGVALDVHKCIGTCFCLREPRWEPLLWFGRTGPCQIPAVMVIWPGLLHLSLS